VKYNFELENLYEGGPIQGISLPVQNLQNEEDSQDNEFMHGGSTAGFGKKLREINR